MTEKKRRGPPKGGNSTSWKKGQSANPGGRSPRVGPNGESLAEMIRGRSLELVERAYEIGLSTRTDPKDALTAIFGLLDRGWGKPKEQEDPNGSGKGDMTQILMELLAKLPS